MLQAANAVRGTVPPAVRPAGSSSLLLTENQQWIGGPPPLMDKLTPRERELVLKQGRRKCSTAARRCSARAASMTASG